MNKLLALLLIMSATMAYAVTTEECLKLMDRENMWQQTTPADGINIQDGTTTVEYKGLLVVVEGELLLPKGQQIRFVKGQDAVYLELRGYNGQPDTRYKVLRIGEALKDDL